ncbi:MAG: GNAT family N-acetyltransferase [Actinomycetota bacterium]|nr:GNAT family N-acetyltransferase [Actinomycetota bacterium]
MEYLRTELGDAEVVLRDLREEDIEAFVAYWHESPPEHLDFLGVDREKLGTPDDTRERFRRSIRDSDPSQERVVFVVALDGRPVAYINLHLLGPEENYIHGHVVDAELRNRGIASLMSLRVLEVVFREFPIETLTLQTRATNARVNHVLEKLGLELEPRRLADPDGLPTPGDFRVCEIDRAFVRRLVSGLCN